MTPLELERIARRVYGHKHWCSRLALNLGLDNSTIWRATKKETIPHLMEVAIRGLDERDKQLKTLQRQDDEQQRKLGLKRPVLKRKKVAVTKGKAHEQI